MYLLTNPKGRIDQLVNSWGGYNLHFWKCSYNQETKEVEPRSQKISYWKAQENEWGWFSDGSIQRTIATTEIVLDLDTKNERIYAEIMLARDGWSFEVWNSFRDGGWIRVFIKELGMYNERTRVKYRHAFIQRYGGESLKASEKVTCPMEHSIHHKSLQTVQLLRKYDRGKITHNNLDLINNRMREVRFRAW